jgi:hypothetical protein
MRLPLALPVLFSSPFLVFSLNLTVYRSDVPLVPTPLPPSHAQSDGNAIVELFQTLGRSTVWESIANISFEGNTYEPEGMVRLGGDRYIVSAGEYTASTVSYNGTIINGTDRTAGAGFAHLIVFDGNGSRIADATLTAQGAAEYHNGGIDFDGEYIWATIAQYRPNTTAHVARIDPTTLQPQTILEYNDHLGGIVHDVRTNSITALNWGSRNASTWYLNLLGNNNECSSNISNAGLQTPFKVTRNPSYYVDYQDCKFLGHAQRYDDRPVMLCSGVATIGSGASAYNLGGIAIVDVETMLPLAEVPITMVSALGVPVTENPVDVSIEDGKLRLFWLPDQHNSTLYVYEAQPNSPYEY